LEKVYQDIHREIIELSKAGNERAQSELYSLYSKAMFNLCLRMLNDRENALDAFQDAFTEVFNKLESFRFESSFGAWAKRIMVNTCLNKLKSERKKIVFTEELEHEINDEDEYDVEESALKIEKIKEGISQLPEGYRIVLNLYLMEGYDHKEISQILDITESTSKTQYMKAKKKLKQLIEDKNER
jgi:RNA polymerase sigma-70 factor (ECF subfamily)